MRAVAAALLLAGLLVAGCTSDDTAPPTSAPTATSAPSGSSANPAGDDSDASGSLPCVAGVERVGVPAGADDDDAMAAYCTVVELTREHAFTRLVLPGEASAPRDFRGVRPLLTDRARSRWDAAVHAWLERSDPRAGARLDGLSLHDVAPPQGYRVDPDGAIAFGTTIGPPVVRAAGTDGALEVRFRVETGLVLVRTGDTSGRHSLLPVTKRSRFVVVPDGDRWLVDMWDASFERGRVRIVTGG